MQLKKKFLSELPALGKVIKEARFSAKKHKTVTILDGREVPVRSDHKALNTQIQGDGAIIMKLAQVILNQELQTKFKDKVYFMATVHDEWQLECHPDVADEVGQLGVEAIIDAGVRLKCLMPMDGEYRVGKDWSECH